MTQEEGDQYIKEHINEYLCSITTKKGNKYICPICGSGTGINGTPATGVKNNKYSCFKCGNTSLDTFHLIEKVENITKAEAFKKARAYFNIDDNTGDIRQENIKKDRKYHPNINNALEGRLEPHNDTITEVNYDFTEATYRASLLLNTSEQFYIKRGLSYDTRIIYNLGYTSTYNDLLSDYPELQSGLSKQGLYNYIIPFTENDGSCNYFIAEISDRKQIDNYSPKYLNMKNPEGKNPLRIFNERYIKDNNPEYVFICEGIYDALSYENFHYKAMALMGTSGANRLLSLCKQYQPKTHFIISLDNDKAGSIAADKVAEGLTLLGIPYTIANAAGEYKDPNEALIKDREGFSMRIAEIKNNIIEAKGEAMEKEKQEQEAIYTEYKKNNAKSHIKGFINGIEASIDTPAIATGFTGLDHQLDGGLYEGLYIIGAIPSLGKTTFILQIADQIAKQGNDILIFSLEMARTELMAKSISRITFTHGGKHKALTTRGITAGKRYENYNQEQKDTIKKSIEEYATFADKIYISEGMGDVTTGRIVEMVKEHIKITGNKPIVIIDYLQIIAPADTKSSDKQNTDKAVFELKRMSRELKLAVIGISSFNRSNYSTKAGYSAFKESGAIEYSSDVLMGLQFQAMNDNGDKDESKIDELKRVDIRKIELKILKNRNGQTGGQINYNYDPKYNYFQEDWKPTITEKQGRIQ